MKYNSNKNQDIKGKFVGIHVLLNLSNLIYHISTELDDEKAYDLNVTADYYQTLESNNWFSKEDILSEFDIDERRLQTYCDTALEEFYDDANYFHCNEYIDDINVDPISTIDKCSTEEYAEDVCHEQDLIIHYDDVLEHWAVTDYLANKLIEQGEKVEEFYGLNIWCRTTYGQAILLDHCISMVCEDMEILEGQKYEWNTP